MLNHLYGILGVLGTLITIATSYIRNQSISQWLLISSGWIAALIIGWCTHRSIISLNKENSKTVKELSDSHVKVQESTDKTNRSLIKKNESLIRDLADMTEQKERLQDIASYLATQNPQISAKPRAIGRSKSNISGGK